MPKPRNLKEANKIGALEHRAHEDWRRGRLRSAFRFFFAAAKAGSDNARETIGGFYDHGTGVKANEDAALHWYRLAYRGNRSMTAANNMGCIWRDRGETDRALMWFRRAVRLGDGDANLNIAKVYLNIKQDKDRAIYYLNKARKSKWITEGSREDAKGLLKEIRNKRLVPRSRPRGTALHGPVRSAHL